MNVLLGYATRDRLAWNFYHTRDIANFTREINDFPNVTISIRVGSSAASVAQLAAITNVTVGVASIPTVGEQIGVNGIVGTGLFSDARRVSFGAAAHFATGFIESIDPFSSWGSIYGNTEAWRLLENVQDLTVVEPLGPTAVSQVAISREYSLTDELARLHGLPENWDGEGAPRMSEATCATADTIIKGIWHITMTYSVVPAVLLGPLPDGRLRFECAYADKELFLTVSDREVEVQAWQPRDALESHGYWKTGPAAAMEHLEWLVK